MSIGRRDSDSSWARPTVSEMDVNRRGDMPHHRPQDWTSFAEIAHVGRLKPPLALTLVVGVVDGVVGVGVPDGLPDAEDVGFEVGAVEEDDGLDVTEPVPVGADTATVSTSRGPPLGASRERNRATSVVLAEVSAKDGFGYARLAAVTSNFVS
jgi:hypothetical protein